MHRQCIEEDIDVEQVFRPLPPHPAFDGCTPARRALAPRAVARHHAALAQRDAGGVEDRVHLLRKLLEVCVLRPALRALRIDDGIVLVSRKLALAAAAGAQHHHGKRHRRRAQPGLVHAHFGQLRSLAGHAADLGADDRRDVEGIDAFLFEVARHQRQLRPRRAELRLCGGAFDLVAQHDGGGGAMAQKIPRRHCADDLTVRTRDAEVAETHALDASDCAIQECRAGDGLQRRFHHGRNRRVERARAAAVHGAQQVALGHDAGFAGRRTHEHAADPLLDQHAQGIAHRRLGRQEQRRGAHHVLHAVPVGEAVQPRQGTRVVAELRRFRNEGTARARLVLGQRPAGGLRFGQRADILLAQARHEGEKDARRCFSVAYGRVPAPDFDAEPFAQPLQAVVGQRRRRQPRQHAHVERAETGPVALGETVLALQHGQIVVDGIAD